MPDTPSNLRAAAPELLDTSPLGVAQLIIKTLDTQKLYFKERDNAVLVESKMLEKKLRQTAEIVIAGRTQ